MKVKIACVGLTISASEEAWRKFIRERFRAHLEIQAIVIAEDFKKQDKQRGQKQ